MTNLPTKVPFSISMLGWALNEEESIGDYIDRAERCLRRCTADFELILIDDGSTDATWGIATAYQATRPWLTLHRKDRHRGPGYNTKRAVWLAQKDFFFFFKLESAYEIDTLLGSLHLLTQYDVLQ